MSPKAIRERRIRFKDEDCLQVLEAVKRVEKDQKYSKKKGGKWQAIHNMVPRDILPGMTANQMKIEFHNLTCEAGGKRINPRFVGNISPKTIQMIKEYSVSKVPCARKQAVNQQEEAGADNEVASKMVAAQGVDGGLANREDDSNSFHTAAELFSDSEETSDSCFPAAKLFYEKLFDTEWNEIDKSFGSQLIPTSKKRFCQIVEQELGIQRFKDLPEESLSNFRMEAPVKASFLKLYYQITAQVKSFTDSLSYRILEDLKRSE